MFYQQLLDLIHKKKNQELKDIITSDPSVLQLGDHRGKGILLYCMQLKNYEMVEFLVRNYREDVQYELNKKNTDGFSVLYISMLRSDFETLDLLVNECGMDPDERNSEGVSLLEISQRLKLLSYRKLKALSRKKNESIVIDGNIVITVVEIRGDKVRLGINAPKEVPIHRSEIHAAIQSEQHASEENPPQVTPAEA